MHWAKDNRRKLSPLGSLKKLAASRNFLDLQHGAAWKIDHVAWTAQISRKRTFLFIILTDLSTIVPMEAYNDDATPSLPSSPSSSSHPHWYTSATRLQSNMGFSKRSLTLLCTAQAHCDAASLEDVCGGYCFKRIWKCSAHSPHGYNLDNNVIHSLSAILSSAVGSRGNLAVIVCSNYNEEKNVMGYWQVMEKGGPEVQYERLTFHVDRPSSALWKPWKRKVWYAVG